MEFDNVTVLKVKLENGEKVKIISFLELPKERVKWVAEAESGLESLQRGVEIVELCLMNPKDIEKFESLDGSQFMAFITEWTYRSAKANGKKRKKKKDQLGEFGDN
jgi:hypothetical protein